MRIFITGGTGHIGSAVIAGLVDGGLAVTALNRSPEKDELLAGLGASPVRGDVGKPETYREVAAGHDAFIHCAFSYDTDTVEVDRTAVETLVAAGRATVERADAQGESGSALVLYTSGCWVLGDTGRELADEAAPTDPAEVVAWRPAHEDRVLEAAGEGLVTAVVRPGMVYGGHGSLSGRLFRSAVEAGAAEYVGDGQNHWSMIHREDLARLYAVIAERGGGGVFHGVDGSPVHVVEAARAASEAAGADGRTRALPLETAREKLGLVADALILDQRLAARRSAELGWTPERPSFPAAAEEAYREWLEATERT